VTTNIQKTADFVRCFFNYVKSQQICAAVLHGGDDGFERELSDVDFVVYKNDFKKLPSLIESYCKQSGWRLCQILRHESTAAYFVCSAEDDPACAVALDACSDYQRDGATILQAKELLSDRRELAWGGYGLTQGMELRYRFAKAAAKNKDACKSSIEFAGYSEKARCECSAWLKSRWKISLESWKAKDLEDAFIKIRKRNKKYWWLSGPSSLLRVLRRVLEPTGLVIVTGPVEFSETSDYLNNVFGHLYFRRHQKKSTIKLHSLLDLICSTLIVVSKLPKLYKLLLPTYCLYKIDHSNSRDIISKDIANILHNRCIKREKIFCSPTEGD
jgi:hypothetical protein